MASRKIFVLLIFLLNVSLTYSQTSWDALRTLTLLKIQNTSDEFVERASKGDAFVVKLFLDALMKPDVKDSMNQTALTAAAAAGHVATVQTLLARGADPNLPGGILQTSPLAYASGAGHTVIVQTLLKHGSRVKGVKNALGCSPLIDAVQSGHTDVMEILLDAGSDLYERDIAGNTLLISAAMGGHASTLSRLLAKGLQINTKNLLSRTALMYAAEEGHTAAVEVLLKHGADKAIQVLGVTALELAKDNGHQDIVKLLEAKPFQFDLYNTPLLSQWSWSNPNIRPLLFQNTGILSQKRLNSDSVLEIPSINDKEKHEREMTLGREKNEQGDYRAAIEHFSKAIVYGPSCQAAYLGRGQNRALTKEFQGALADLNQVLKINPNSAKAYYWRGWVKYQQGDYPGTIHDETRAIKLEPKYSGAYLQRGCARYQRGEYRAAIADFDQVLALMDPRKNFVGADKVTALLADGVGESGPFSILVISENQDERNRYKRMLEDLSYTVTFAREGEEGLRMAQSFPPKDLVIVSDRLGQEDDNLMKTRKFILKMSDSNVSRFIPIAVLVNLADRDQAIENLGTDHREGFYIPREDEGGDLQKLVERFGASLRSTRFSVNKFHKNEVAARSAAALARIDPKYTKIPYHALKCDKSLHTALINRVNSVRLPVIAALATWSRDSADIVDRLVKIFRDTDNRTNVLAVRRAIMEALARINPKNDQARKLFRDVMLSESDPVIRRWAAIAHGRFDRPVGGPTADQSSQWFFPIRIMKRKLED